MTWFLLYILANLIVAERTLRRQAAMGEQPTLVAYFVCVPFLSLPFYLLGWMLGASNKGKRD